MLDQPMWPCVEALIYQTREGSWRARLRIAVGSQQRTLNVPEERGGFATRLRLFAEMERALLAIGAEVGLPSGMSEPQVRDAEVVQVRAERDRAFEELTLVRAQLAAEKAASRQLGKTLVEVSTQLRALQGPR